MSSHTNSTNKTQGVHRESDTLPVRGGPLDGGSLGVLRSTATHGGTVIVNGHAYVHNREGSGFDHHDPLTCPRCRNPLQLRADGRHCFLCDLQFEPLPRERA